VTKTATATAGKVTIEMPNKSGVQHDLTIEGDGVKFATPIISTGVAKASGTLKPGKYVFYCSVPGHRQAGMQGTLTVK
jgi:plastocyanin